MLRNVRKPLVILAIVAVIAAVVVGTVIAAPRGKMGGGQGMSGKNPGCMGCCAQDGMGMMGKGMGRMMGPQGVADSLNLTPDQKAQIQSILTEHRNQVQQLMQSNLTPEEKTAKRQELRQDMIQQMQSVLTPDQQAQSKQMWQQRPMMGRRGMGMLQNRMQQCFQQLNLSDAQKEQIAAIRGQNRQAVREIKLNTRLSDQEKLDQIKELRGQTHEQVMSVLTPEQLDQLKQMCPMLGQGKMVPGAGQMQPGSQMKGNLRNF